MLATYLAGVLALAVIVFPLWWAAVRMRAYLLPGWRGPRARLAEAVTALSVLVALSELVGIVHLFRRLTLSVGALAVAAIVRRLVPSADGETPDGGRPASPPEPSISEPTALRVATWAVVGATGAAWTMVSAQALNQGINEFDTVTYHLPSAATFVQTASLSGIHYNGRDFASAFGPLGVEVFHAVGMIALRRDALLPLLNLGWLALALLVAWCIGRPSGRPHLSLLGTAAVLGTPLMVHAEAGTAKNDVAVVALLVAVGALLVQPDLRPRGRLIVALAAGLLLGTKLTALIPVVILAVGLILLASSGERRAEAARWALGLAPGAFWYLRDWISVGSPLPDADLAIGPLKLTSVDEGSYGKLGVTVAHYVSDPTIWRTYLWPQIHSSLGWGAVVFIGLAVVGLLIALRRGPSHHLLVGVVGLAFVAMYLVTPFSAMGLPGTPTLFGQGLRFVLPALALGLGLLAGEVSGFWSKLVAVLLVVSAAVAQFHQGVGAVWPGQPAHDVAAAVFAAIAVSAVVVIARRVRWTSARVGGAVASLAIVVLPSGYLVQRHYLANRYVNAPFSSANAFRWARGVHGARIGLVGFSSEYPLYGLDLSNHVHYVGLEHAKLVLPEFPTCQSLRAHLDQFHYDYVVVAPQLTGEPSPPQTAWLASDPNVKLLDRSGPSSIFQIIGPPDPRSCS